MTVLCLNWTITLIHQFHFVPFQQRILQSRCQVLWCSSSPNIFLAIMDSANNQLRDHSNLYFPYSNGGVVSIQFHCFFSIRKYGEQYRRKTSWRVLSRVSWSQHQSQSLWPITMDPENQENQSKLDANTCSYKRRAKMVIRASLEWFWFYFWLDNWRQCWECKWICESHIFRLRINWY